MPSRSFQINQGRNRTAQYTHTFFEDDGTTGVALAATDSVRFKVYSGNNAIPILDLTSGKTSTPNGSSVTVTQTAAPATAQIQIAQADTAGEFPATYDCEIIVVDDSLTSPVDGALSVERGVLNIMGTGGGNIDLAS